MKKLIHHNGSRAARSLRLAASATAVAVAVAGAAGIVAAQASAAQPVRAKLKRGVLTIDGSKASDRIALRLQADNPDVLQVDVDDNGSPDATFERENVARIAIDAGADDDLIRIDERNGAVSAAIPTTIDGGAGNDSLAGGAGAETLLGGVGNDSIDGNGGDDVAFMGAGDDTFVWDPGDSSDRVEGQDGADAMLFNGANGAERVAVFANGSRLTFHRDPGTITMDTAGVERVDFNALGGADQITVDDLTGTDVDDVNVDLASTLAGAGGDGQPDQVAVNGTAGDDTIDVSGDASGVAVSGLSALVTIEHQEPANDALAVNGLGGNDRISAAALATGAIALTLDGGAGEDTIAGGQGVETLGGGEGNDSIDGNGGNDVAFMGAGDDTFVWDPGDGSDRVEGEDGEDAMLFNGANGAEQVDVSANGSRLTFFRNPGTITMDTAGVERVDFNALGGADQITVNDLTGTDVSFVNVDLAGTLGGAGGDGLPDRVAVNATNGNDTIDVRGGAEIVKVGGLAATVDVLHPEVANDRLEINTLEGVDTVSSAALAAGAIQLFVDGALVP
jgi:Ca2+-binding RTX toxin-like protein